MFGIRVTDRACCCRQAGSLFRLPFRLSFVHEGLQALACVGRLASFVDPQGGFFSQSYSEDGTTVEMTDGRGRTLRWLFDEF